MKEESPFSDVDRLRHEMRIMQNDLLTLNEDMRTFNAAMALLLRLETQRQDKKKLTKLSE